MMGINDIGWPDTILVPKGEPAPSANDVIAGYKQITLATAHLHHDPTNNQPRNLKAPCERCRMIHDRDETVCGAVSDLLN
jgi:hypothetical protein